MAMPENENGRTVCGQTEHALIRAAADPARDDAVASLVREHEMFVCGVADRRLHFGNPFLECIAAGDDLAGRRDAIVLGHELVDCAQVVRWGPNASKKACANCRACSGCDAFILPQ